MLTITILIIVFFLLSIPCAKEQEYDFPKEKTDVLKAILPLFIILHHAHSYILTDFIPVGKYVVAMFFCLSGYGLESKVMTQNSFSFRNFCHRLKMLFFPTFIPVCLFLILLRFKHLGLWTIICDSIKDFSLPLPNSWFIVILAILYFLFFLAGRIKKYRMIITFVLVLTLNLYLFFCFRDKTQLYGSNFAFVLGIILKQKESVIVNVLKRMYLRAMLPLVLIASYMLIPYKLFAIFNVCIYSLVAMMMFYTIPFKSFKNNCILTFLKEISYENYLCHGIILVTISYTPHYNFFLYIVLLVIATIALSAVSHKFTRLLFKY